jgi:hypothetical protein
MNNEHNPGLIQDYVCKAIIFCFTYGYVTILISFFIESIEMTKASSKSATKPSAPINPETDTDDDDIFESGDFVSLSESLEEETVKRDSRRKIEIYWEKKRLKEQFDDFDESEFGF